MTDDKRFAAFLFDMDGTLISSILAAERIWGAWARRHGLDPDRFFATMHGMRTIETIERLGLPGIDVTAEAEAITRAEIEDLDGIVALPGALDFLRALPAARWAIVTSAPRDLALHRLAKVGIVPPAVFVTSEDVEQGKPKPDCYLLAAHRLGVAIEDCLVFEDADAGVRAGESAGAAVMVITATHKVPMVTDHPAIRDYRGLSPISDARGLGLAGLAETRPLSPAA